MVVACLLSVPLAALNFGPAPAMKYLSDKVLIGRDPQALRILVMAIPSAFLLNLILRFSTNYLMRSAANQMIQNIRNDLYQHLLKLSIGYFNEARAGVLLSHEIGRAHV